MPRSSWSMTRDDPRHETSVYHQHQPHWLYIGSHVDDMTCFMIFSGCYMTVWYYIVVIGWSLCDTIVIYKHTHIYIQLYTHTHIYIYIYHVWKYDALKCLNICWYPTIIPPARGDLRVGGQVVVREGVLGTVVGPSHSDAQHRVTVSFSHREDSSRNRLNCVVNEIKLQRALGDGWEGEGWMMAFLVCCDGFLKLVVSFSDLSLTNLRQEMQSEQFG